MVMIYRCLKGSKRGTTLHFVTSAGHPFVQLVDASSVFVGRSSNHICGRLCWGSPRNSPAHVIDNNATIGMQERVKLCHETYRDAVQNTDMTIWGNAFLPTQGTTQHSVVMIESTPAAHICVTQVRRPLHAASLSPPAPLNVGYEGA